ncbi:MAG TPA: hypothetical protein VIV40_34595 [Kofleriaceae bacterium]
MIRCLVILALLVSHAAVARAEDLVSYQAEGDAPAGSADARVMALDEAFARAVGNALSDLVAGDVRTARKGELDREIVARARLWVAKFAVTKDETVEDRRELTVSVKIDRDKLRAKLAELKIATKDGATTDPSLPAARTATILLRITAPGGVRAVYGPNAVKDVPGLSALTSLLRTAGFAVRRAPSSGAPPRADGELPLSDDEAGALADEAKAEVMAIAGVSVGPNVAVRGQPGSAALVSAHVRIVDRVAKKVIGQGASAAAMRGDDPGYAIDRALMGAAVDVMPPAPTKLGPAGAFRGEDVPLTEQGVVLVRLPARTPYSMVLEEQKYLAGAKGVRAATLRRLSPAGWVIGVVTSEPVEQVARIAKKAPATDTATTVKVIGEIVELSLSGAP